MDEEDGDEDRQRQPRAHQRPRRLAAAGEELEQEEAGGGEDDAGDGEEIDEPDSNAISIT